MTKAEIMRRLHDMVDQLATVPDEWFEEGIYPLHKVTFAPRGFDDGEPITLVVGISDRND